jgi:hypothetical protein
MLYSSFHVLNSLFGLHCTISGSAAHVDRNIPKKNSLHPALKRLTMTMKIDVHCSTNMYYCFSMCFGCAVLGIHWLVHELTHGSCKASFCTEREALPTDLFSYSDHDGLFARHMDIHLRVHAP